MRTLLIFLCMAVGVHGQTFIRSAAFRGAASFQGTASTNAPPAVPDYDGPTWVTNGAVTSGTGNITPAVPTGYQVDDIMLMFVENCSVGTSNTPTGWGIVTNTSNQTNFYASGLAISQTGLEVFWKRATASESAPTLIDRGNHTLATTMLIRGAETNGYPFDVAQAGVKPLTNVVVSITNGTTAVNNTLIVLAVSDITDSAGTARWNDWYNASLGGLAERFDSGTVSGDGGGIGLATGYATNAGAFNVTTNWATNSSPNAFWAIAVKKIQPVAPAITVQPTSIVAVTNTVETFTVTATGNPAVAYQWNYAGADISGATGASFATNSYPTATAQTNNVFVVVSNSVGSVTSATVTAAWTIGVTGTNFSDDFNRANGALGASWKDIFNFNLIYAQHAYGNAGGYALNISLYTNVPSVTVQQYGKVTILTTLTAGSASGLLFRGSESNTNGYFVRFNYTDQKVYWESVTAGEETAIGNSSITIASTNDSFGVVVSGVDNSTVVSVWRNPANNAPTSTTLWGGASATVTLTNDPATAYNTGKMIGIVLQYEDIDDFYGGDCP